MGNCCRRQEPQAEPKVRFEVSPVPEEVVAQEDFDQRLQENIDAEVERMRQAVYNIEHPYTALHLGSLLYRRRMSSLARREMEAKNCGRGLPCQN